MKTVKALIFLIFDTGDNNEIQLFIIQVPPSALSEALVNQRSQGFSFAEKGYKYHNRTTTEKSNANFINKSL